MIKLLFTLGNEGVLIVIDGKDVKFGNTSFGNVLASIDNLRLSYPGVCKEHPDLKGDKEWKTKSIKRFKAKINEMASEEEISNYLIGDLKQYGYIPKYKERKGFRPQKIK